MTDVKGITLQELINKYKNGFYITNVELFRLIRFYKRLLNDLNLLDCVEYTLVVRSIEGSYDQLVSWRRFRKIRC